MKLQGKGSVPGRKVLVGVASTAAAVLGAASLAWACTAPVGGTFYCDGSSAKTVARGTRICAFATRAEPGFNYRLVIADPNGPSGHGDHACMDEIFIVNPTLRLANAQGVIAQTAGPAGDANTRTGTFQLCFQSTDKAVGTGPATITLI